MKTLSALFLSLFFLSNYCSISLAQTTVTIGGTEYQADTLSHFKVGPGSYYTAMHYYTSSVKLRTFFLEVDATNPYISFEAVHGKDSLITCEGISSMAQRKSKEGKVYFGGTNADFFATSGDVGYPIHGSIVEGQMGRTPAQTPHIAFSDKDVIIDNMLFANSTCSIGEKVYPINGVNVGRGENQLILYNTLNGNYTHTNAYGVEVLVQLESTMVWTVNKDLKVKVVKVVDGKGNMQIPAGHAVLSGHGTVAGVLKSLVEGDELTLFIGVNKTAGSASQLTAMVGGDRIILKDGVVQDNDWAERHPRTAIGYSADGKKVYFCVVDGRSSFSTGLTTKHLADIMKSAGATTALNLDGGGSSGMYLNKFGLMNTPSDGHERAVSNGIFAVDLSASDDVIAEILPYEKTVMLPVYGSYTPVIYGYNQYGTLINLGLKNVTYSCEKEVGTVREDGSFFANGSRDGILKVKWNQLETSIHIKYLKEEEISLRLDSVIIDGYTGYPVELNARIGDKEYPLAPYALEWSIDNPTICSINDGIVTGLKNGETIIRGTLDDLKCALKVKVQIPEKHSLSLLPLINDEWTVKASTNIKNIELLSDGIRYTYSSGRSPFIELAKTFDLYSLPNAIRFMINPGNAAVSKVIISGRENLSSSNSIYEYTNELVKNQDAEILLAMKDWFAKEPEHASFPIHFSSIKFPLVASGNVAGENTIYIRNMELIYDQISVGLFSLKLLSSLVIYPNPTADGRAYVALKNEDIHITSASIFSPEGRLLNVISADNSTCNLLELPVSNMTSGIYLIKVCMDDGSNETMKLIIK